MVTFGDKSKAVLTNLRFCQTAVTPSPSVSCFQTFQRVLIQNDHPSSQTTQKGEECVLPSSRLLLQGHRDCDTAGRWPECYSSLTREQPSWAPGWEGGARLTCWKHRHSCWGSVSRPEAQGTRVRKKGGGFTIPYHTHFMELQWLDSQGSFPLLTDAL